MDGVTTFYASPERVSDKEILESHRAIESNSLFKKTLDAMPELLMILNGTRQIVYLNEKVFKVIGENSDAKACGLRPGELFECTNLKDAPNGCGTSKFCQVCGLINTIFEAQRTGRKNTGECRLLSDNRAEALDLRVTALPVDIDNEMFIIISLEDISDEKRRQALERIFFHDILNLAGGIQGISYVMKNNDPAKREMLIDMIETAVNSLIDEIKAQKQLKQAERGDLPVNDDSIRSIKIINDIVVIYEKHEVAENKRIEIEPSADMIFISDRAILMRVLGNMLKNALEATPDGGFVRIGCRVMSEVDKIEFHVWNSREMTEDAKAQVFHRSFSTKGTGRGLGTYSIKLLGEQYLKGTVGFTSQQGSGTCFHIRLKT